MNAKTQDTKQHILDVGYQLVIQKGFTSVGLSELLKTAEVPKGSFYHYFSSKEQFGEALVQAYFVTHLTNMNHLFNQENGSEYDKLMRYWQAWAEHNSTQQYGGRCLVVKLAGEVSDLSESMRLAFQSGTEKIISGIAHHIQKGITAGEFELSDGQSTAESLYNLWIGASLLAKIRRDDSSLQLALQTTEHLLKGK